MLRRRPALRCSDNIAMSRDDMANTIVNTTINHGIVPGEGSYGLTITVTSAGRINGPTYAILGLLGGATIVNDGIIHGDEFGILMPGESHILNQGHIYGVTAAVGLGTGATLINDGTVAGGSDYGVGLFDAGSLNNAGLISAKGIGVYLNAGYFSNSGTDFGTGAGAVMLNGRITNTGTILGNGVGLDMANGAAVNQGIISGALSGVGVLAGSFTNYGIISGTTAGLGLLGGSVTNEAGGMINGGTIGVALSTSSAPALVTNDGVVTGEDGMYIVNGTLANGGSIAGQTIGVYLDQGTVTNTGQISGGRDGIGVAAGTIDNQGLISGATDGVYVAGGELINEGTISGGLYAVYAQQSLDLTLSAGAVFDGQVVDASGHGHLILADQAAGRGADRLDMGGSFSGFSNITFAGKPDWTLGGTAAELAGGQTISGFADGDTIDLEGFAATSRSFISGTGLVLHEGVLSETLGITGSFSAADFGISSDGNGGTDITACFAAGTRISAARGKVPVERLRIGDLVKTLDAGLQKIKWIGVRAYAAPFLNHHLVLPIHIRVHAFGRNMPSRALTVSPGHGMFVDGAIVPAWRLVNGVSITQARHAESITYYHVELEGHAIIFAENCPAESFLDDDCRNQFHNAAEFSRLYPGDHTAQRSCHPRIEIGFRLRAIQNRLNARAGMGRAPHVTGPLRGFVDQAGPRLITGWAQDIAAPETPVAVDVFVNGIRIARILANGYRADLRAAGLGSGCHAFEFLLPAGLRGGVRIRRAADGAALSGMGDHQALRAVL
jgi:hypothetical protein